MGTSAIEFRGVWKKFRRGEHFDSLRDFIPEMTRKLFFKGTNNGDLSKREFWALQNIDFSIGKGDVLGIIGPNGSGKSTILKLISGILQPSRGQLSIEGRISSLIEVGAGFHPDLTGRENIFLNATILGMKKEEIKRKYDDIVEFAGLEKFIDTPVKRYSSGMYARLGFSVAAHVDPDILLVDEVLSVGDLRFQEKCLKKMLSFRERGTTVIFISHNLEAVSILCPKTAFLINGVLQDIGDTGRIIGEYVSSTQVIEGSENTEARFEEIRLVSNDSVDVHVLDPSQKVYVRFKVSCDLPFDECLLGFLVYRKRDGLLICDYNFPLAALNSVNKAGRAKGCVEFHANLLRGSYSVTLHVQHEPSRKHLVWVRNAVHFSVEERISWNGVAHLAPRIVEQK